MSFVGRRYRNDVFVSYSHAIKEEAGDADLRLRDWSREVASKLRDELNLLCDPPVAIFCDVAPRAGEGLDPMAPLTQQLKDQAQNAAILLVIMSNFYNNSPWCRRELEFWVSANAYLGDNADLEDVELLPRDHSWVERIAVVKALRTTTAWPQLLEPENEKLPGFEFFSAEGYPLGWTGTQGHRGEEFNRAVLRVGGHLKRRLEQIKQKDELAEQYRLNALRLGTHGPRTIYLHARAEDAGRWNQIADQLSEHEFVVLGEPEALDSTRKDIQSQNEARVRKLARCDALVLINQDSDALDEDMISIARHDRHAAKSFSNRPLPCAYIDPVGSRLSTAARTRRAKQLQVAWLDETSDTYSDLIHRWLETEGGKTEGGKEGAS